MRTLTGILLAGTLLVAVSLATAQRPGGGPGASQADDLVPRMMEFDKDNDGKLSRLEVTDDRLLRLFDRADADKDGILTKEELTALAAKEAGNNRGGPRGGGPGGPMMGPPRPGEVLPPMLRDRLNLTPAQKSQVDDLQKEVDSRLESILNDEQKAQLKEMRQRGPGRPGGGGPPPGFDRPR